MWSLAYALSLFVLYIYAGHLTWWRMLITDPGMRGCAITTAVRENKLPFIVYAGFVTFWLPLLAVGWVANKTK